MSGNTIGTLFRVTTFGESHGPATGGVVDGCPAGLMIDMAQIRHDISRRKASNAAYSTKRIEDDEPQFISGIFEGKTTGAPIAFIIPNQHHDSSAYHPISKTYRPGHGDYSWHQKYGHIDPHGGGRYSARETLARVIAGAIARHVTEKAGIVIQAWVSSIGKVEINTFGPFSQKEIDGSQLRCPDKDASHLMEKEIAAAIKDHDTLGGVISASISGVPVGLGEPVFDKVEAELAKAMLSIPSVKAFGIGDGFHAAAMRGSEHNDLFSTDESRRIMTLSNHAGGTLGGLTSGSPLNFRVAFKPVSSLKGVQPSVTHEGKPVTIDLSKGRHDVCVVPRAVPVVEAMAAIVLADLLLRNRSAKW
jgi:chorismate synthase